MKHIVIEPFGTVVHVCLSKKDLKKNFGKDLDHWVDAEGYAAELTSDSGNKLLLIYLPNGYNEEVLWHECLHMTHFIMKYHGIDVDESVSSSETQCYLQAHIVDQVKRKCYKTLLRPNP